MIAMISIKNHLLRAYNLFLDFIVFQITNKKVFPEKILMSDIFQNN
jgi:hypothetical protein